MNDNDLQTLDAEGMIEDLNALLEAQGAWHAQAFLKQLTTGHEDTKADIYDILDAAYLLGCRESDEDAEVRFQTAVNYYRDERERLENMLLEERADTERSLETIRNIIDGVDTIETLVQQCQSELYMKAHAEEEGLDG